MPDPVDFAHDVFPALLEHDVPFHVHEIDAYWNDIGTLREYLQGNLDAVSGAVALPSLGGELATAPPRASTGTSRSREGPLGDGCRIGEGGSRARR